MDRYLQSHDSSHSRLTRMSEFFGFQMWNLNVGTFVISTQGHYEVVFEIYSCTTEVGVFLLVSWARMRSDVIGIE